MSKVKAYTKTLYLMRHATASMDAKRDFDRPLTAIGERDARHMGRWLNEADPAPDQIISSPALRANTTASILMEELHQQHTIHLEEELYEASIRTFLQVVNALNDQLSCVLIVAHNPAITYLADYLTTRGIVGMMPGAMVGLGIPLASWSAVSQHSAELIFNQSPNQLPHGL